MRSALEDGFPELLSAARDERGPVVYVGRYREFGLRVPNGPAGGPGDAFDVIAFCPFTGRALPASLRDEWFDRMEGLGIEPGATSVPARFQTEAWWADPTTA